MDTVERLQKKFLKSLTIKKKRKQVKKHWLEATTEEDSEANYCILCGVDMGPQNPRQLCRKTYCLRY